MKKSHSGYEVKKSECFILLAEYSNGKSKETLFKLTELFNKIKDYKDNEVILLKYKIAELKTVGE